jgi:phosphoglycerol transferase MdoB-like AlkP superfamily enzyme
MKFVFSEKKFYPFILLLLVGWFVFSRTIYFLKKKFLLENKNKEPFPVQAKTMLFVAFATLNVWGARGFNFTRPPGIREAFFTGNSFINQFTLNPVLTFFESFSLFKIDYTDDETSIKNVQRFLNIDTSKQNFSIERNIQNNSIQKRKNIVLVLMESMSANRMGIFGEKKNLTPFLDSLAQQSLFFNNFYSCGIHTCNGVYGTLLGMPSLMAKHPMSNIESSDLIFCGMPLTLKKNNYSTLYFCTHGEEFDNIRYFLPRNGMEKLFGSKDYPSEKIENVWGVNDEFLFDFALNKIDSFAKQDRPFFSTLLTISTHPPQQMPKHTAFKPKSKEVFDQVFEYADFALQQFMQQCKNKSWYNNTIFVFLADHGVNLPGNFEAPLSLNHIPLIIFSPDSAFKKETNADFGIQCDLYPTLMNLLGISYQNNSMGIDLLKQKRLFAYFSQDNRLCVINDKFYLVIDKYGSEYLYQYKSGSDKNYAEQFPALVDSMKTYAYSFLQTTQWMIENKKVGAKN